MAAYSGNKDAVQSPNGAIAPGATITVYLPQDTDGNTYANFYQEMKTHADAETYLLGSSRPDFAVLNAGSTGFTAPTYSAFGGTVTPSGSAHISDGTRFMLQIQTGGAVGVATFKTSMDGGVTYGALQTTAASMTDVTSGVTLAFAGTLTALGTAGFRSAFTPLADWRDAAGNRRGFVDHLGYRRGRLNDYYEDWLTIGSATTTGANTNTAGRVNWSIPAAAAIGPSASNNTHFLLNVTGTNVANATTTRVYSAQGIACVGTFSSLVCEFEASCSATANDVKIGFNRSAVSAVATPSTAADELALCAQAADTNWQLLVNATGSGGVTKIDTGVAKTAFSRVTLEWHGSASPYGAVTVLLFINEALVASATTNVPAWSGLGLPAFIVAATTTNATNSLGLTVSPVHAISPRYASIPAI